MPQGTESAGEDIDSLPQICIVPSAEWPTLARAAAEAPDGAYIQVQPRYSETLTGPLILDRAMVVEGPTDGLAEVSGEEGIIVAAGASENAVVLRRLRLRVSSAPAMVIAGGCCVEDCRIEAAGVGIEVCAHAGTAVQVRRCLVSGCNIGVSLAGAASAASLEGSRVEACGCGVVVTGLDVSEGWSEVLASVAGAALTGNKEADLRLRGWSVQERATGLVRKSAPGEEVSAHGWPAQQCSVVAPTDHGPVVLHFASGRVNATLFEDDEVYMPTEDDAADANIVGGTMLEQGKAEPTA